MGCPNCDCRYCAQNVERRALRRWNGWRCPLCRTNDHSPEFHNKAYRARRQAPVVESPITYQRSYGAAITRAGADWYPSMDKSQHGVGYEKAGGGWHKKMHSLRWRGLRRWNPEQNPRLTKEEKDQIIELCKNPRIKLEDIAHYFNKTVLHISRICVKAGYRRSKIRRRGARRSKAQKEHPRQTQTPFKSWLEGVDEEDTPLQKLQKRVIASEAQRDAAARLMDKLMLELEGGPRSDFMRFMEEDDPPELTDE